jgi:membrane protease YdiL (CAAX protease family)
MPKDAIALYLWLTLAFSAVAWTLITWSGHLNMGFGMLIPALMWCPALAVVVTCRLLGRDLRSLAWRWPNSRYIAAAYFVPLAYTSVAYGVVWASRRAGWNSAFVNLVAQDFGLQGFPAAGSLILYVVFMATGGVIQNLSMTLGEEIGWRGFLVPELAKQMSFTKTSFLSGFVWAAWHCPLVLCTDYTAGTNRWYALACSTVMCVSLSFILAWLRLKSDSLWPPALLHASHNLFVPGIFDRLVRNTGQTFWYTTVFGAALAATTTVFALYLWMRRSEIENPAMRSESGPSRCLGIESGPNDTF